jgi:hypothetical protein
MFTQSGAEPIRWYISAWCRCKITGIYITLDKNNKRLQQETMCLHQSKVVKQDHFYCRLIYNNNHQLLQQKPQAIRKKVIIAFLKACKYH